MNSINIPIIMSKKTICECGFKHREKECPLCGQPVEKEEPMVQKWNSTLKANPKKRPRQTTHIRARSNGKANLAKTMREYVEKRAPNSNGRNLRCDNCGKLIPEIKFENVSHKQPRSLAPQLAHEFSNLEILCGPTDYWGEKDTSCHTLWERNNYAAFRAKSIKKEH